MEKITFRDYSFVSPYIDKMTRRDTWVKFDSDNLYPERVMEIVNSSPLQKSILESKKTYILGAGLEPTSENIYTPNMMETWQELIEKCTNDFVYLNAFAVQVILKRRLIYALTGERHRGIGTSSRYRCSGLRHLRRARRI